VHKLLKSGRSGEQYPFLLLLLRNGALSAAGDEHWTKVLQANDVLGKLAVCPYHGKTLPLLRCAFAAADSAKTTPPGADGAGEQACRRRRRDDDDAPAAKATAKERTVLATLFDRFADEPSDTEQKMRNIATLVAWSVVTVSRAEKAEPIEMPFGV